MTKAKKIINQLSKKEASALKIWLEQQKAKSGRYNYCPFVTVGPDDKEEDYCEPCEIMFPELDRHLDGKCPCDVLSKEAVIARVEIVLNKEI